MWGCKKRQVGVICLLDEGAKMKGRIEKATRAQQRPGSRVGNEGSGWLTTRLVCICNRRKPCVLTFAHSLTRSLSYSPTHSYRASAQEER